jgi:NHL repeat
LCRTPGIAVHAARDRVYLTDAGNRCVQVFTTAGPWVASWAPTVGLDRFEVPGAIAVDPAGRVYVADALARRLWQLAPDGTVVSVHPDGAAEALAVDRHGQLHLVRGDRPWIDVATPADVAGDWTWARLPLPSGVRATGLAVRDLWVIDRPRHRVVQLDGTGQLRPPAPAPDPVWPSRGPAPDWTGPVRDTWGQPGGAPGQLWQPHALALDPAGQLYVADLGNARIQSLTPDGALGPAWGGFRDPRQAPGR